MIKELVKRSLVIITLAYISGIIIGRTLITDLRIMFWLAAIILLLFAAGKSYRSIPLFKITLIFITAAAGAAAYYYAVQVPDNNLLAYAGNPVYLEGTIIEEPLFHEDHAVYHMRLEKLESGGEELIIRGTLLVKIYGEDNEIYWFGERIGMRGTIVPPRSQRNPGGFDYRFYLRSQGIDALIYPSPSSVHLLGGGQTGYFRESAMKLRSTMTDQILNNLPSPSAELLTAILFGQRQQLPAEVEENFRRAGAGHLMAVSGLHVGLVAALILGFCRLFNLKGIFPAVVAIVCVFIYAYLTGMRPSSLRAAIMVSIALVALLLEREQDLPNAISLAAMVTLFMNPLLLFSIGFQLSYAATLAIVYIRKPLEKALLAMHFPEIIISPLAVTAAAQLGVVPISVYYFHHLPVAGLIFNLLLLPVIALVVGIGLSGALLSIVFALPGSILLWAARPLLEFMLLITGISSLPWFYMPVTPPKALYIFTFYIFIIFLLALYYRWESARDKINICHLIKNIIGPPGGRKLSNYRLLIMITLCLIIIIAFYSVVPVNEELLIVTFLDVGQGAAAVIETPCNLVIMVDAGGRPAFRGDPGLVGERIILPFLRYKGITRIDMAFITHPHEDHFGGFIPFVDQIPVEKVLISPVEGGSIYYHDLINSFELAGSEIIETGRGDLWHCRSDLKLKIVGPPEKLFMGTSSDLNNNSIVFFLTYKNIRILFTGDIEDPAVKEFLRTGYDLSANLLLVPHHGGYLEAMPELLDSVRPDLAVIQVGHNSFGHPHPYVLQALDKRGITVYRNDLHGAVTVETDGIDFRVFTIDSSRASGF